MRTCDGQQRDADMLALLEVADEPLPHEDTLKKTATHKKKKSLRRASSSSSATLADEPLAQHALVQMRAHTKSSSPLA